MAKDTADNGCASCTSRALYLLARREHSRRELERKLVDKGFAKDDVVAVVDKLEQKGLLSNNRFAESYARMRVGRGYGPQRIRLELRERGIAEATISEVLSVYQDEWSVLAERARRKKFGSGVPEKYSAEQRKQQQFLLYRGFNVGDHKMQYSDEMRD
jgi:regulatory protein